MKIYIIVAKNFDLPGRPNFTMTSGRIISHAVHAALKMEEQYMGDEVLWECDTLILALPHNREFTGLMERLIQKQIPFTRYEDTDRLWDGEQLTAICTFPISQEQSECLKDLKTWRCACNNLFSGSSEKERLAINQQVEGSSPSPRANLFGRGELGQCYGFNAINLEEK